MSRSMSVTSGGPNVRSVSLSGPAVQEMVKVAVLPPRLPGGVAPPTGLGPADVFSWDESINWSHNEKINEKEVVGGRKFLRGIGLSTKRQKAVDTPPFIFREVTYDTWRKHYAKDKAGRYKGTEAPAEDCLLLPEDVAKWSYGPPETKADLYTRGKAALPVYDQVEDEGLPTYTKTAPALEVPDDDAAAAAAPRQGSASTFTADGKTSEQIIAEAKERAARGEGNLTWKQRVKKGSEFALLGANF